METQVKKWGNSAVVRIPKLILTECGLSIGTAVEMVVENKKIVVSQKEQDAYFLEDLLKGSTPSQFKMDTEDHKWVNSSPAGQEIL